MKICPRAIEYVLSTLIPFIRIPCVTFLLLREFARGIKGVFFLRHSIILIKNLGHFLMSLGNNREKLWKFTKWTFHLHLQFSLQFSIIAHRIINSYTRKVAVVGNFFSSCEFVMKGFFYGDIYLQVYTHAFTRILFPEISVAFKSSLKLKRSSRQHC